MKNDRYLKFTTLKITIAVIISLSLHLIFFTKFEFNELFTSKNNDQANELEIFVTSKKEKDINQTKPKKITKPNNFEKKLILLLKDRPQSIQDLNEKLYFEPAALKEVIERLLKTQKIYINHLQQYHWINE